MFSSQVAALSGDARRALDICRRATELAELETTKGRKVGLVGMKHVDAALQEMFSSPKIIAMRSGNDVGLTIVLLPVLGNSFEPFRIITHETKSKFLLTIGVFSIAFAMSMVETVTEFLNT